MERIKAKINKLKEDIDACEERESEAKTRLNEANARFEAAETEKSSFLRRLQILEKEVAKTNKRLAEKQELLDNLLSKAEADETAVKNLENLEVEGDEKLVSLADMIKRGQLEVEDYDTQLREAIRKEVVLKRDNERIGIKIAETSSRIEQYMDTINNASSMIKVLEAREDDQSERDLENEQKIDFLNQQIKEALVRTENAERDSVRLSRALDSIDGELNNCKNKTESVRADIESMGDALDDMC